MAAFVDATGRSWVLAVNIGKCLRCKEATGIDLMGGDVGALFTTLGQDLGKFAEVLWQVVEHRPDETADAFYAGLAGDALDGATSAFVEAMLDFFPRLKRAMARKIADRTRTRLEQAAEAIEGMSAETLDQLLTTSIPTAAGSTSGPSPGG